MKAKICFRAGKRGDWEIYSRILEEVLGPGMHTAQDTTVCFEKNKCSTADVDSDFTMYYILTDWRNMGFDFGR